MGQWMELVASDGARLSAYRADPDGGPRGALIVAQEIFGINSHVRSVCDGFASDGYVAIAPALFDRVEQGVELGYSADEIARGREYRAKVAMDLALLDITAARDAVGPTGRIGVIGYCWGGLVAWMAASRLDGFACAVPYYGGGMIEAIEEKPKCPVMAHFGERDAVIPVAGVEKLRTAHPEAQVFLYPAGHGFNCEQRESYDAASAKLARERTLEFFRRHIG